MVFIIEISITMDKIKMSLVKSNQFIMQKIWLSLFDLEDKDDYGRDNKMIRITNWCDKINLFSLK
jgi:hypothetical protein